MTPHQVKLCLSVQTKLWRMECLWMDLIGRAFQPCGKESGWENERANLSGTKCLEPFWKLSWEISNTCYSLHLCSRQLHDQKCACPFLFSTLSFLRLQQKSRSILLHSLRQRKSLQLHDCLVSINVVTCMQRQAKPSVPRKSLALSLGQAFVDLQPMI